MFQGYTERARWLATQGAAEEARRLGQSGVGTDHLLLAICREKATVAAHALQECKIDYGSLRRVISEMSPQEKISGGYLFMTPRLKTLVERARNEANRLNMPYVGSEHLLLALAQEEEGIAFQALTDDRDIQSSLDCVYKHLTDDGIFIVNVFDPNPDRMSKENWCYPETVQWERLDEKTGNYVVKKHWGDRIDTENRIIYPHFAFEVTYPDGKTERIVDDLQLKYYYNDQLRAVIEKAKLEIIEEYSWYDMSKPGCLGEQLPKATTSPCCLGEQFPKATNSPGRREIIFVCRRKRS